MSKQKWCNVRIRPETHARLCEFIQRLRRAAETGQYKARNRHLLDISLDDAISELLNRQEAHAERSRKAGKGRNRSDVYDVGTPLAASE